MLDGKGYHEIKDDLPESFYEDQAEIVVQGFELLLAKHAAFALYLAKRDNDLDDGPR